MVERVRPTIERVRPMSADLAARRVIVAAYCYYVLDESIMSDGEYDKLSVFVADHWDELDDDRKWALDTPRATRSSGHHIYFSAYAVHAAHAELQRRGRHQPMASKWRYSKERRTYYVTATN